MNQKKQIEIELRQVGKFLSKLDVDLDSLIPNTEDPPDLLLNLNDKQIGIEHTMVPVKNGEKLNSEYKTFDKVISEAQSLYEQDDLPPNYVVINFKSPISTRKNKKDKTVKDLLDLVSQYTPELGGNEYVENFVPSDELPYFTDRIKISRHVKYTNSLWQRPGLVWSGAISNSDIIPRINNKNERLIKTQYYRNFDEVWLLLVVEGKEWSDFATLKPDSFVVSEEWRFDKIYICQMFGGEYERLK